MFSSRESGPSGVGAVEGGTGPVLPFATSSLLATIGSRHGIPLFTVVFAFCSMAYELLLAQTLSAVLGNTVLRYTVTIGFYVFALGMGALCHPLVRSRDPLRVLLLVEIALAFTGGLSAYAVVAADGLLLRFDPGTASSSASFWALSVFAHGVVILIGVLSGLELPLLMQLGESGAEGGGLAALVADYGGTLIAAVAFPLLLLPGLGVLTGACALALLNALAALALVPPGTSLRPLRFLLGAEAAIYLLLILARGPVNAAFLRAASY